MNLAAALLAILAGAAPTLDDLARAAVEAALAVPSGRTELIGVESAPARCDAASVEAPRPITASGRAVLRIRGRDAAGQPCDGWAWARVRVSGPTLVTSRALREGEPLSGAARSVQREIEASHAPVTQLPEGARAARALAAGTSLDPASIRVGPIPGDAVTVSVRLGALRVDEVARAAPCRAGRACAVLPSGRRVEGSWHDGRIVLETP